MRKKLNEEDKKKILTLRINILLLEKLDNFLKTNDGKRSRLVEKLLKNFLFDK